MTFKSRHLCAHPAFAAKKHELYSINCYPIVDLELPETSVVEAQDSVTGRLDLSEIEVSAVPIVKAGTSKREASTDTDKSDREEKPPSRMMRTFNFAAQFEEEVEVESASTTSGTT